MELNNFLVKAKIATYASSGESRERRLDDGAKELTYEEAKFKYRDRYYGSDIFSGEEVVWKDGKIVWSMNYHGRITSMLVSSKKIGEFLRKAMRQVKEDRPFRGPNNFKEGGLEYVDASNGDINWFNGMEKILFKGQEIYRLYYHGGSM